MNTLQRFEIFMNNEDNKIANMWAEIALHKDRVLMFKRSGVTTTDDLKTLLTSLNSIIDVQSKLLEMKG